MKIEIRANDLMASHIEIILDGKIHADEDDIDNAKKHCFVTIQNIIELGSDTRWGAYISNQYWLDVERYILNNDFIGLI